MSNSIIDQINALPRIGAYYRGGVEYHPDYGYIVNPSLPCWLDYFPWENDPDGYYTIRQYIPVWGGENIPNAKPIILNQVYRVYDVSAGVAFPASEYNAPVLHSRYSPRYLVSHWAIGFYAINAFSAVRAGNDVIIRDHAGLGFILFVDGDNNVTVCNIERINVFDPEKHVSQCSLCNPAKVLSKVLS